MEPRVRNIIRPCFASLILLVATLAPTVSGFNNDMIDSLLKSISITKCRCLSNEYYSAGKCHQANTTIPVIISPDFIDPILEPMDIFGEVSVSELKCPAETSPVSIQPRDLFILALTGEIYHVPTNQTYGADEFCVNHLKNDTGSIVWEVELCLQPPIIQVCCMDDESNIEGVDNCDASLLSIWFGFSLLKEPDVNYINRDIQCGENEVKERVPVGNPYFSTSYISYESASALLVDYSGISKGSAGRYLSADSYCINPKSSHDKMSQEAVFCVPDPMISHNETCNDLSCVRKCCPPGMLFSKGEQSCIPYDSKWLWKPKFISQNGSKLDPPIDLRLIYGFPICDNHFYALDTDAKDDFRLARNGHLFTEATGSVPAWRYCVENFLTVTNTIQETALTCFPDIDPQPSMCSRIKSFLYPTLLILSCLFLGVTLAVYAAIPELHAKLHGKSLLSHVTALLIAYLFLAIIQWGSKAMSMPVCRVMGFVLQISFLGAFFWLNVMCFDIWWALRSMRPAAETSASSRRRFWYYSIYAWGCPLIIGAVTFTMELLPKVPENRNLILPGFGRSKCWFDDNRALWAYFYSFVSILTVANITFFVFVAVILLKAQRANNDILRFTRQQHQERIWIYLKLFVVMGINWICEIISWQEGSCEYWLVTDIINALQGFFIFLIFICKRNVCEKLKAKWRLQKRKRKPGSSASDGSSRSTLQSTLESSTRKLSSLHHHLSRLQRDTIKEEVKENS